VLDMRGRIVRFNRACEQTTGYSFAEVEGKFVWELFLIPEEFERSKAIFEQLRSGTLPSDYESYWLTRSGEMRLISWSSTVLTEPRGGVTHIIATGIDITERKALERAVLEISSREQRRIGQDLHDGLGQHLTGVAFLSKVLQAKLLEASLPEAVDAAKIVALVNEAIKKTRELARGLLPVVSEAQGLMSALERWAGEVSDLFDVSCRFECRNMVLIHNDTLAYHLYYLAQEAVSNAIKHGKAKNIFIGLEAANSRGTLTISDDGGGFEAVSSYQTGMGMRIMNYRAKMIGGSLDVQSHKADGTVVVCLFPIRNRQTGDGDGA